MGIAALAAALLIPWAAGTVIASESFNPLIWGLLGSLLLISGTKTLLHRAISIRIPGGLRSYTQDELRQMPTIIPNAISYLAQAATILLVGTWSLSHRADEDHGFTVGMLAMMAGAFVLLRLSEALSPIVNKEPLALQSLALSAPEALASAFIVFVAVGLDRSAVTYGLMFAGLFTLLLGAWRLMTRVPHGLPIKETLDDLSDTVLHQVNPAPTLEGRNKARILTRSIALAVVVVAVILMLLL